jgi:Mg-chelatase subunit ChlD
MKTLLRASIFLFTSLLLCAAEPTALTQQQVIQLLQLKTPESEIIAQIKAGGTTFTLGAADIAQLKRAGATPAIIAAMQGGGSAGSDLTTAEISDLCLVIDYSGSMNAKTTDGSTKIAAAKQAVGKLIDDIPSAVNVAVVVYGCAKDRGCEDIDLIQPLGPIDKATLKAKLMDLKNTGMTPIAASLDLAGLALKNAKGGRGIILVTDGVESCKGDPAAVAAKLATQFGVKFGLHVVGFDIKSEERASLEAIAKNGHGKYFSAQSASELTAAMQKVTETVAETAPEVAGVAEAPPISTLVKKNFNGWDNPLHSEFSINDKTIDIFTSDTFKDIGKNLKEGWNTIAITTRPQEPANDDNKLTFTIGVAQKDAKTRNLTMQVPLWRFDNGTDWKFEGGKYSHPLGPEVKEVTLSFPLYFAGLKEEGAELKAGDYVLVGKSQFGGWNPRITATVSVNGTTLNSFLAGERQIVITPLLKEGKNEIKIISKRVKNAMEKNDIAISVGGPAEWVPAEKKFKVKPVTEAKAMQGWEEDKKTGQLVNAVDPESDTIERTVPFFLEENPGKK